MVLWRWFLHQSGSVDKRRGVRPPRTLRSIILQPYIITEVYIPLIISCGAQRQYLTYPHVMTRRPPPSARSPFTPASAAAALFLYSSGALFETRTHANAIDSPSTPHAHTLDASMCSRRRSWSADAIHAGLLKTSRDVMRQANEWRQRWALATFNGCM